jgi:hypothetical protein
VVLVDFLRANADIFAWSPSDMLGTPREVAEHSLDILPHSRAYNSGCAALTKSDVERSEWSCESSSRPGSSRKFSPYVAR